MQISNFQAKKDCSHFYASWDLMEVATRANLVFLARKLLEEEENSVVTEEDFKVFVVKLLDHVSVLKKFRVTEDGGEEGEAEGREGVGAGVEEGEEEEGGEDLPGGEEGELFTELQYRQGDPCFIWSTVVFCGQFRHSLVVLRSSKSKSFQRLITVMPQTWWAMVCCYSPARA